MPPLGTTAGAPSATPKASDSAPALLVPFTRAATEHTEDFFDQTFVPGATSQQVAPIDVPAYGFMRGIFIEVTSTGNAGINGTSKADGPFTAITDVSLSDVNGAPIYGPFDGYESYLVTKYCGIRKLPEPRLHPDFKAVSADGGFSFLLYIPVEVNPRDALGSLGNMNAASAYKLRFTVAPEANVYGVNPSVAPSWRIRAWLDAWSQPPATSLQGQAQATEPPAHGTTSYWSKQTFNVNAGQQQFKQSRVGNYIRNLILVNRDNAGVRNGNNMPQPTFLSWDTRVLRSYQPIVWRGLMAEKFDLKGANDAAGALDTGVFVEDYMHEFDGKAGLELRDGWLPTVQSTRLEWTGSWGAAGTLTIITNDVSPNGEVFV